jgi:hypothetical protein
MSCALAGGVADGAVPGAGVWLIAWPRCQRVPLSPWLSRFRRVGQVVGAGRGPQTRANRSVMAVLQGQAVGGAG